MFHREGGENHPGYNLLALKTAPSSKLLVHVLCCSSSVLTHCDPVDGRPAGSSVHRILQARMLEWVVNALPQEIFPTQGSNPGLSLPKPHCVRKVWLWRQWWAESLRDPLHTLQGAWAHHQGWHLSSPSHQARASRLVVRVGQWSPDPHPVSGDEAPCHWAATPRPAQPQPLPLLWSLSSWVPAAPAVKLPAHAFSYPSVEISGAVEPERTNQPFFMPTGNAWNNQTHNSDWCGHSLHTTLQTVWKGWN